MLALLGPPGAGKTTQARLCAEVLDATPVSIGALLRQRLDGTPGTGPADVIQTGNFVTDDLAIDVLRSELADSRDRVILDGFPRTPLQAYRLGTLDTRFLCCPVVLLWAPHHVLIERLLQRSATENRSDDRPEPIRRRLELYELNIGGVTAALESCGHEVTTVDSSRPTDVVSQRVSELALR